METKSFQKHYLDTSILRPLIIGTQNYKKYLNDQFGNEPCYISKFIQMEFSRSYLLNIIDFYFTIRLPTMLTIANAINYWSNKYKSSQLKAIIQLVATEVLKWRSIDFHRPQDKSKGLRQLERVIKRIELKLRRQFKDTGIDSTRCARAAISIKESSEDKAIDFRNFLEAFNNEEACRNKCRIDHFLLTRYLSEIKKFVKKAESLPTNDNTKGFKKIAKYLTSLLEKGDKLCSCKMCSKVGDAVITLDAPSNMRLEHIDKAFDYLCPIIDQPHKRHPSESQLMADKEY